VGSFSWNVTLSVVSRLFYYGVVCASLIALRRKQPSVSRFRLPAGPLMAVLGILICAVLMTQVDLSQSRILAGVGLAALLNWAWVRWRQPAKA
jgi:amino acid transporter